jgi:hypothetical protein
MPKCSGGDNGRPAAERIKKERITGSSLAGVLEDMRRTILIKVQKFKPAHQVKVRKNTN